MGWEKSGESIENTFQPATCGSHLDPTYWDLNYLMLSI